VTPDQLSQLFTLYSWFPLAALHLFLALIARYYEQMSGERTRFRWYALPAVLFGIASVRFASVDRAAGDPIADGLSALGGLILLILIWSLYRQMIYGRKHAQPPASDT